MPPVDVRELFPQVVAWLQFNLSCPAGRQEENMEVQCVFLDAFRSCDHAGWYQWWGEMQPRWCMGILWAGLRSFTQSQGVLMAPHLQCFSNNTQEAESTPSHFSLSSHAKCLSEQVPDLWTRGTAPVHCKNVDFSTRSFYLCLCSLVNRAGMKWHRLKLCVTLNIGLMIKQKKKGKKLKQ